MKDAPAVAGASGWLQPERKRGPGIARLREVADQVSAERGVRLGDLRLIAEAPPGP